MTRQPEIRSDSRSATPTKRLTGWFALAAGLTGATFLGERLSTLQNQLEILQQAREDQSSIFRQGLVSIQQDLRFMRGEVETTFEKADAAAALTERLRQAESRLGDLGQALASQSTSLTELERERENFGPEVLEEQLEQRDERLMARWEDLASVASSAREAANETRAKVEQIDAVLSSPRDLRQMWRELVGPVVQLSGDTSVGSGVLLRSERLDGTGDYRTYLVTAWHVVRDIQGDLSKQDMPVPVRIYGEDGSLRDETAQLLCFDASLDSALLELRTTEPLANGAALPTREHLEDIRIFDQVYAVGCPLGNDPIPSHGEISTTKHVVDGETYWMINAPTYIGNSGGGIFDSETHELLGIFSKIYTHGTLRPTIVPHMGLVTPMESIYDWLETQGYGSLMPESSQEVAAN